MKEKLDLIRLSALYTDYHNPVLYQYLFRQIFWSVCLSCLFICKLNRSMPLSLEHTPVFFPIIVSLMTLSSQRRYTSCTRRRSESLFSSAVIFSEPVTARNIQVDWQRTNPHSTKLPNSWITRGAAFRQKYHDHPRFIASGRCSGLESSY